MNNNFPLYLPNKKQGFLVLPSPLTEAEFGMLEEQVNNALWIAKEVFIEDEQPAAIKQSGQNVE